jgi:hypothetical protein
VRLTATFLPVRDRLFPYVKGFSRSKNLEGSGDVNTAGWCSKIRLSPARSDLQREWSNGRVRRQCLLTDQPVHP